MALNLEPHEPNLDPNAYVWFLYGREGIGKTVTLAGWPDIYIIATEPGAKGLRWYGEEVGDWEAFVSVVTALEKSPGEFKTVGIDTVDLAYQMALRHTCDRLNIAYPGTSSTGKEDYGKSWNQVYTAFTEEINRIARTGRGLVFTSHAKEVDLVNRLGSKYTRVVPTITGQARRVVDAMVDIGLYAEYFKDASGTVYRLWMCHGDDMVWAKTRKIPDGTFPMLVPLMEEGGADILLEAFRGEHPGVDPVGLMATKETSKGGATLVGKAQVKSRAQPKSKPKAAAKRPARKKPAAKKRR